MASCPCNYSNIEMVVQLKCDKTVHLGLNVTNVRNIVHVDLDPVETERNIVHVHEDLSVKSTVRA